MRFNLGNRYNQCVGISSPVKLQSMKTSNHSNWILIACVCAILISVLWKGEPSNSGSFISMNERSSIKEQPAPVELPQLEPKTMPIPMANSSVITNPYASKPLAETTGELVTTEAPSRAKPDASQMPASVDHRDRSRLLKTSNPVAESAKSISMPAITFENAVKTSSPGQNAQGDPTSLVYSATSLSATSSRDSSLPTSTSAPSRNDLMSRLEAISPQPPATNVMPISGAMLMTKLERGESLARRGAWATAQNEFVDVLNMMAQQVDLKEGGNATSRRLRDALMALDEARDFTADGGTSALDVSAIISRHQSKILNPEDSRHLTNFAAAQAYYSAARVLFHETFNKNKLASRTFYSLGKLHSITSVNGNDEATQNARAMLFHYAALDCDDRNYPAANELGVMLAKSGRLPEARDVLNHCANVQPTISTLQSLARVNHALGDDESARRNEMLASNLEAANKRPNPNEFIPFIDQESFNAIPDVGAEDYTAMNNATTNSTRQSSAERAPEAKESRWKLWR